MPMMRFVLLLTLVLGICPIAYAQDEAMQKAQCYIRAYPEFFRGYDDGYLIASDGSRILFDDHASPKDCWKMVTDKRVGDSAFDPEDAFFWDYDAGDELPTAQSPPEGDPGRIRPAEVFKFMYGKSKEQRRSRMRPVRWVGGKGIDNDTILVTTVNGVDKAIENIAEELRNLPEEKKLLLKGIVFDVDGFSGYHERQVRDYPKRTSAHAYGIAVDVNHDESYFIGRHRGKPYTYRNNMPHFLVDIFERHGFIWGGRWQSYDIMHFEYRPELMLDKGKGPADIAQKF